MIYKPLHIHHPLSMLDNCKLSSGLTYLDQSKSLGERSLETGADIARVVTNQRPVSRSRDHTQPIRGQSPARYLHLPIWSKDGLKMHNNPGDLSKFSETAHHKPDGFRPNFFTLPVSLAIVLRQTRLLNCWLKQKVKDNKSFKREFET